MPILTCATVREITWRPTNSGSGRAHVQWRIHTGGGDEGDPPEEGQKIFLDVSENRFSERILSLILFVSSAFYVEYIG